LKFERGRKSIDIRAANEDRCPPALAALLDALWQTRGHHPEPLPYYFVTVAEANREKKLIRLRYAYTRTCDSQELRNGEEVVQLGHEEVMLSVSLEDPRAVLVHEASGKQLSDDEIWDRLTAGTTLLVAPIFGGGSRFHKLLAKDALILAGPQPFVSRKSAKDKRSQQERE